MAGDTVSGSNFSFETFHVSHMGLSYRKRTFLSLKTWLPSEGSLVHGEVLFILVNMSAVF